MALVFSNIHHKFGATKALKGVDLCAEAGEITCLLGPSGCGKTTLLSLAAGILKLQQGDIRLNEKFLAKPGYALPPEQRSIGLVFQEGALFPHMNVAKNIAFGISKKQDREKITKALLQQMGLEAFRKRYPHSLSGGQQQRVAVARALAAGPAVLLLDEPFANIDILRRRQLRSEIRQKLKDSGCVTLLVTHDPEEALEVGDQIAVMMDGKITQFGDPQEIYQRPNSAEIALLLGDAVLLSVIKQENKLVTAFGTWPMSALVDPSCLSEKGQLLIRKNAIEVREADTNMLVAGLKHIGPFQIVNIKNADGDEIALEVPVDQTWKIGDAVELVPRNKRIIGFADP